MKHTYDNSIKKSHNSNNASNGSRDETDDTTEYDEAAFDEKQFVPTENLKLPVGMLTVGTKLFENVPPYIILSFYIFTFIHL